MTTETGNGNGFTIKQAEKDNRIVEWAKKRYVMLEWLRSGDEWYVWIKPEDGNSPMTVSADDPELTNLPDTPEPEREPGRRAAVYIHRDVREHLGRGKAGKAWIVPEGNEEYENLHASRSVHYIRHVLDLTPDGDEEAKWDSMSPDTWRSIRLRCCQLEDWRESMHEALGVPIEDGDALEQARKLRESTDGEGGGDEHDKWTCACCGFVGGLTDDRLDHAGKPYHLGCYKAMGAFADERENRIGHILGCGRDEDAIEKAREIVREKEYLIKQKHKVINERQELLDERHRIRTALNCSEGEGTLEAVERVVGELRELRQRERVIGNNIGLTFGEHKRDGNQHVEWHFGCGCALHPVDNQDTHNGGPHIHPCAEHAPDRTPTHPEPLRRLEVNGEPVKVYLTEGMHVALGEGHNVLKCLWPLVPAARPRGTEYHLTPAPAAGGGQDEQGDDEPDDQSGKTAWDWHAKRCPGCGEPLELDQSQMPGPGGKPYHKQCAMVAESTPQQGGDRYGEGWRDAIEAASLTAKESSALDDVARKISQLEPVPDPTPADAAGGGQDERGGDRYGEGVLSEVAEERAKQRRKWGDDHDDACHQYADLAVVAAALAVRDTDASIEDDRLDDRGYDRWGLCDKHSEREALITATALLVAEIERRDRQDGRTSNPTPTGCGEQIGRDTEAEKHAIRRRAEDAEAHRDRLAGEVERLEAKCDHWHHGFNNEVNRAEQLQKSAALFERLYNDYRRDAEQAEQRAERLTNGIHEISEEVVQGRNSNVAHAAVYEKCEELLDTPPTSPGPGEVGETKLWKDYGLAVMPPGTALYGGEQAGCWAVIRNMRTKVLSHHNNHDEALAAARERAGKEDTDAT